jgi:hypothetical protein
VSRIACEFFCASSRAPTKYDATHTKIFDDRPDSWAVADRHRDKICSDDVRVAWVVYESHESHSAHTKLDSSSLLE